MLQIQQQPTSTTVLVRICVACHQKFRTTRPGMKPCPSCGQPLTLVFDSYTVRD